MGKIQEVLRLQAAGHSQQQIAHSCGIGRSTVGEYLQRARRAGLGWPLPAGVAAIELERRLFPPRPATGPTDRGIPDWATVHPELRRPGVTLWLLWEEYKATHQGYQYTWFCQQYRTWAVHTDVVMRQTHRAGENLFVDYAGPTVPSIDRTTGELRQAQLVVAVLGASSHPCRGHLDAGAGDWLMMHVRAFAFFGGV